MSIKVAIATDHGGLELKEFIKTAFEKKGYVVEDLTEKQCSTTSCSYSCAGHNLANFILKNKDFFGVGICGSGIGISIAVNRHKGIRGARITSENDARLAKLHNNANILLLGGRFVTEEEAVKWIETYIDTTFEGGRHIARIEQLDEE